MWRLKLSIVVKRELSQRPKLSMYRSIYVPTLTYELQVVTERMRLMRLSRCLLDVSLGRGVRYAHPGGDPGAYRGHAGEILSLAWLRNI